MYLCIYMCKLNSPPLARRFFHEAQMRNYCAFTCDALDYFELMCTRVYISNI